MPLAEASGKRICTQTLDATVRGTMHVTKNQKVKLEASISHVSLVSAIHSFCEIGVQWQDHVLKGQPLDARKQTGRGVVDADLVF